MLHLHNLYVDLVIIYLLSSNFRINIDVVENINFAILFFERIFDGLKRLNNVNNIYICINCICIMHRYHNETVTYDLCDPLPIKLGRRDLQDVKSAQQVATVDDRVSESV